MNVSDSNEDRLRRVASRRADVEEPARHERYDRASADRLRRIVRRKLTTSFIGPLSKFEQYFGHLWGHGLDSSDCTPEQNALKPVWEACRNDVLNNGNGQIRAAEAELDQYTVHWNRYRTVLPADGSSPPGQV